MAPFFSKTEAVLFSPLKGTLTYKGEPAANAEITLLLRWKDDKGETFHYRTNERGEFSIPEHRGTYRGGALVTLVVDQEIRVTYKSSDYLIWDISTKGGEKFGELGAEPSGLRCELLRELESLRTPNSLGKVACKWD
ncbi:DUF6795 domain-containing protein [Marinimicrobium alkaliphilum]|uniref:DUF6795 domain-containing protein n=1 Tax=Marinimicrobium alkaliphilum TaxID=2202654 RepID=UPI000DB92871|nr:DUF6795 domain-containing protein [Marinimicrobium alkaliphilum]